MSNMNDLKVPDMAAFVAFGKLGVQMVGARILSILSLVGMLGAGGAVIFYPTWHGVVVCAILALVAISAQRGEGRLYPPKEPQ